MSDAFHPNYKAYAVEAHIEAAAITDRFCAGHLNQEYAELAHAAIAALCRKRPSPLNSGSPRVWACAILLALGQINFLSDKSSKPHMATADLRGHFDVAESTASNKAKQVRTILNMHPFDHKWMLPSKLSNSSLPWMIQVNGLIIDAAPSCRNSGGRGSKGPDPPYVCINGQDEQTISTVPDSRQVVRGKQVSAPPSPSETLSGAEGLL